MWLFLSLFYQIALVSLSHFLTVWQFLLIKKFALIPWRYRAVPSSLFLSIVQLLIQVVIFSFLLVQLTLQLVNILLCLVKSIFFYVFLLIINIILNFERTLLLGWDGVLDIRPFSVNSLLSFVVHLLCYKFWTSHSISYFQKFLH